MCGDDVVEDLVDFGGGGDELGGVGGAEVEEGGGGLGDGVDGGAARDVTDVEGEERVGGEFEVGDFGEGATEEEDGVGGAGVGPGVAAGAGDGDAEAQAAEGSGDGGAGASAFEDKGSGDAGAVGAALEEMTHAAEVAFALFAYVGSEEDRDGWGDVGVAKGGGDGEESGEAGGVVADAGGEDAGGVGGFDGVDEGVGGEDGVEVGGEEDAGTGFAELAAVWRGNGRLSEMRGSLRCATDGETVRRFGRDDVSCGSGIGLEFGEGIAGVVEVDVGEAEVAEAVEKPGGAGGFAEGWGGDADQLELPLAELRLVEVQPVEGAVDCGEGGEASDATLGGGGGGHQYSTSTRKRPRAGAVGPAAERLRAARISGMASG